MGYKSAKIEKSAHMRRLDFPTEAIIILNPSSVNFRGRSQIPKDLSELKAQSSKGLGGNRKE